MTVAVTPSRTSAIFRGLRRVPFGVGLSLAFLGLMFFVFLFADLIATHDITTQDLTNRLRRPAILGGPAQFWLGTDELGRDLYSRLIYAIRTSMLVAIAGSLIGAILGTLLGFVAAHFRGIVEDQGRPRPRHRCAYLLLASQ